jgi:peptide/nickel transport system ATP-binding protein
LLELIRVSKHYHTGRFQKKTYPAVDNVSITIQPGKTYGLVGESGSGKTTLGLLATLLVAPSQGEIRLDGQIVHVPDRKQNLHLRRKIQIIFQNNESALDPRMNLSDLIREPLIVHNVESPETAFLQLMDGVGLGRDLRERYPHELSGGQRQRICIARAIALDPRYLIADEPAASLDYSVQAQILELLITLQKEKNIGILFISHHLKIVRIIADTVAVMYRGKIVEKASNDEFFTYPLHPYTQDLISSIPGVGRRNTILSPMRLTIPCETHPTGCRYFSRCRKRGDVCIQHEPELRDIGNGHHVACHDTFLS